MLTPTILFYFPTEPNRYERFQKISDEDAAMIQRFRNEGFSPLLSMQKPYFEQPSLQKLVWIKSGEPELVSEYTEETFPLIKCHIYWSNEIPHEDYLFAKGLFECLLGLREVPTRITRSQVQKLNAIKPYTETQGGDDLMTDIEELKLEDGRSVIQICGGEMEAQVNELIKTLS